EREENAQREKENHDRLKAIEAILGRQYPPSCFHDPTCRALLQWSLIDILVDYGPEEIETESKDAISEDIEADPFSLKTERMHAKLWSTLGWMLYKDTSEWIWREIKMILETDKNALKEEIWGNGNTMLHMVVEKGQNHILEKLLLFIKKKEEEKEILEQKNADGSTALHVAVSVGNKHAMKLLLLMIYSTKIFGWFNHHVCGGGRGRGAVPPIKHIEKKIKVSKDAAMVLGLVCAYIDKLKFHGTHHPYYDKAILEAAIKNANKVFINIFRRSRELIKSRHENGYDIFQLAVIYRSDKIYNHLYLIGEDKKRYKTIKDSSENNMLHLAGRLAPSQVLKRRTGAALQLQRELQWFEELKNFMHPSAITEENCFGETPHQVFTREHENLVKEGEKWMKTTAESCSISAALITTIVFAAAITVPGGSDQQTGIPIRVPSSTYVKDISLNKIF
ncbi:Ankyrin repeat-containing protein, partial [Cynara cardunculus var. scolymus]